MIFIIFIQQIIKWKLGDIGSLAHGYRGKGGQATILSQSACFKTHLLLSLNQKLDSVISIRPTCVIPELRDLNGGFN